MLSRKLCQEETDVKERAVLDVIVSPKSSRSGIEVDDSGNIRVRLNSPPVDGRANEECIGIISKTLRVAKSKITIDMGLKGRKKRITVGGITTADAMRIIGGGK
jgi:uncharacterized protein (TIGR00251 family)